jgi:iron complex transport system ATP-binding protein
MASARRFAADGGIVAAIVHDLNLAAQYADKLIMLRRGRVRFSGAPEAGLTPELLARVFEIEARVMPHPVHGHPLVVQVGALDRPRPGCPHDSVAAQ